MDKMLQIDYRYRRQILEDDPQSQQPENIKTVLKPHQLASLHKAMLLERYGQIKYNVIHYIIYRRVFYRKSFRW